MGDIKEVINLLSKYVDDPQEKINLLKGNIKSSFLRAIRMIILAKKVENINQSLSSFLLSSSAEIMGNHLFKKGFDLNYSEFILTYKDESLLAKLKENVMWGGNTFDSSEKKWIRKEMHEISDDQIVGIYYSIIRSLFVHEGHFFVPNQVEETIFPVFSYLQNNKERYAFGRDYRKDLPNNTDDRNGRNNSISFYFKYNLYKELIISCFVNLLKENNKFINPIPTPS